MNFLNANRTRPYTRYQRKLDELSHFPVLLEQFFSRCIKKVGYESSFEWSAIEKFYKEYQDTLSIKYALKTFCGFVLNLFLQHNCEHESLMIKIIYLYENLQLRKRDDGDFGAFGGDYEQLLRCCKQYHLNSRPLLREVNENSEDIYKDYNFTDPESHSYRSLSPSHCTGDYTYIDYLKYKVKYGLVIIPNCEKEASAKFFSMIDQYTVIRETLDAPLNEELLEEKFELLIATKIRNFRRLILIIDVMLYCVIIDGKYEHASRFGLYSLTLSEPAISQKEVEEWLDFSIPDDEGFKSYALASFKEMSADSPYLPSPRPLKHLCRCKIRDCLPRSPPMPTVLNQIELLPNYLKDYILIMSN